MGTIQVINEIDNTGTLYEEVLKPHYGDDANFLLINTKFLRANILHMIKTFAEQEGMACIKEFTDKPPMIYGTNDTYNYDNIELITTDLLILPTVDDIDDIEIAINNMTKTYPLVVEMVNYNEISVEKWDNFFDNIINKYDNTTVQKVIIEDIVPLLKKWDDLEAPTFEMLKEYNKSHNISHDDATYFQEPLSILTKKYWKQLSFIMTINDYDIYNDSKYLDIIAEKYFNNGYVDEIVIKINYFYWFDNYEKIIKWSKENLKSALVSYRFETVFSNQDKFRYYNEIEANKYDDIQRYNTMLEEVEMFEMQLPILLNGILTNPQTFGFELVGGYFGIEGFLPDITPTGDKFKKYKEITCKTLELNPFAQPNDSIQRIFDEPNKDGDKIFFCVKS